mmetsp:Transcript_13270/g.28047  ORF Transcript_13270/g.28047 Transcript_13270/m.28047 type:complete len:196 (-) Transcript_13270:1241-1828(-)
MSKVNTAPIKWAQRSDSLYITIALPDVKEESIKLADETLKFAGKSEGKEYEVDIVFFKPVDAEGSTYKVLPRSVQMHVMKSKKDEDEEFWPRLLKDKALEKNQVKIDWDRYVDEDEEEEGFDTSALEGGMGMGGMGGMADMMGGMGGMGGGMGGMDMESLMKQMGGMGGGLGGDDGEPDSDDDDDIEDLPELEEA